MKNKLGFFDGLIIGFYVFYLPYIIVTNINDNRIEYNPINLEESARPVEKNDCIEIKYSSEWVDIDTLELNDTIFTIPENLDTFRYYRLQIKSY